MAGPGESERQRGAERKPRRVRLELREAPLRQIVDLVPFAMFVRESGGPFRLVNRALAGLFGLEPADFTGKRLDELPIEADVVTRVLDLDAEAVARNARTIESAVEIRDAAGQLHLVRVTKVPFVSESDRTPLLLGMVEDVTEQRAAERAVEERVEHRTAELEAANEALEREVDQRREAERKLERLNQELKRLALVDSLTGLSNRRHFDQAFAHEWRRGRRNGRPVGLVLADVDWFKELNDASGHPAGDDCLRRIAKIFRAHAQRPADLAARCGGEEFALLLPETELEGARALGEAVRAAVEARGMLHPTRGLLTISVGVAARVPGPGSPVELFRATDEALYAAKAAGRNRLHTAG